MCTFKQALKFMYDRFRGIEFGMLYRNGKKTIVKSEELNRLNILLTENFGTEGKFSALQLNNVFKQSRLLVESAAPMNLSGSRPYKYYNYKDRNGALIFDDDSKLVFGLAKRGKMPPLFDCLRLL